MKIKEGQQDFISRSFNKPSLGSNETWVVVDSLGSGHRHTHISTICVTGAITESLCRH